MTDLSLIKAKKFLSALSRASLKYDEREQARKELKSHIRRLHRIADGKTRAKLKDEIVELEVKIDNLVDKERRLTAVETAQEEIIKSLKKEVFDMHLKHDQQESELAFLRQHLGDYNKIKSLHEKSMRALEAKVQKTIKADEVTVRTLNSRLEKLDAIYDKLSVQGVNKAELASVKKRILEIKKRVRTLQPKKKTVAKKATKKSVASRKKPSKKAPKNSEVTTKVTITKTVEKKKKN